MWPIPLIFRYNTTLSKIYIEDCLYNYMRRCPQLFESGIGIWHSVFVSHLKAKIGLRKPKKLIWLVNVCESVTISLQRYTDL
jgi:hypothetical protein